jgi:hypothetical protein
MGMIDMASWVLWRIAGVAAPAYAFAAIVLALSLAHGNARRLPWRVIAGLLGAPFLMLVLAVLPNRILSLLLMVLFVIADAGFALTMSWRYRHIDPAVAFCGLASIWGTIVVLLSVTIH